MPPDPKLNTRTKFTHTVSIPPPELRDYAPTPKLPSPMPAEMVARVAAERERERVVREEREGVVRANVGRMRVSGGGEGAGIGRSGGAEGVSRGGNAGGCAVQEASRPGNAGLSVGRESYRSGAGRVELGVSTDNSERETNPKRRRTTDMSHPYHDKSVEVGVNTATAHQTDAETETLRHGGEENGMALAGKESERERERKRMQLERFRVMGDMGAWMGNGIGFTR